MECIYHVDEECPVGYGYCHCGCGEKVPMRTSRSYVTIKKQRIDAPVGEPMMYVKGHWNRMKRVVADDIVEDILARTKRFIEEGICPHCEGECPYGAGFCHCGCGKKTMISNENYFTKGIARGMPWPSMRGHHHRVLDEEKIREIRYRYATEDITQTKLAEEFGVAQMTISKICLFDIWKDAGIKSEEA